MLKALNILAKELGIKKQSGTGAITYGDLFIKSNPYPDKMELQLTTIHRALWCDGNYIKYVLNPTEEQKRQAILSNSMAIRFIKDISEDLIELALGLSTNGDVLKFIPQYTEDQGQDLVMRQSERRIFTALRKNGSAIKHVKEPTKAMKLTAVARSKGALKWIKDLDPEIIREAISNGASLKLVPPEQRTLDMCYIASRKAYLTLPLNEHIPTEHRLKVLEFILERQPYIQGKLTDKARVVLSIALSRSSGQSLYHIRDYIKQMLPRMGNPTDKQMEAIERYIMAYQDHYDPCCWTVLARIGVDSAKIALDLKDTGLNMLVTGTMVQVDLNEPNPEVDPVEILLNYIRTARKEKTT